MPHSDSISKRIRRLESQIDSALESENPYSALSAARSLLALDSSAARAWLLLGILDDEERQEVPEDPVTCLLRATELDGELVDAWIELGSAYYQRQDYADALRACRTALRLDRKNSRAMLGCALCYQCMGDARRTVACYRRTIALDPEWTSPRVRLAALYSHLGHESATRAVCHSVLEQSPDCVEALALLGALDRFEFDDDCGLPYFDRLVLLEPEEAGHWQDRGLAQALLGNFLAARASLGMALRLDPDDVQTRLRYGLVLFFIDRFREEGRDRIEAALCECCYRDEVEIAILLLIPMFVLRDIRTRGLYSLTRHLRWVAHSLPHRRASTYPDSAIGEPDSPAGTSLEARAEEISGSRALQSADYWYDTARDSLLFDRQSDARIQLSRALEIFPDHYRAVAKMQELEEHRHSPKESAQSETSEETVDL